MKKIVVSVYNDISTDQRVQKICNSLIDFGFDVLVIGRISSFKTIPLNVNFKTHRFNSFFKKGFLSYAEYNSRLFFKLLFIRKDILLANDLDTLLPNYIVSRIFNKKIVYDSHELFTEVPELINRPFIKNIWLNIEKTILPKLKNCYTVCDSIACYYKNKYKTNFKVVRNFPITEPINTLYPYKKNAFTIIYQGALNRGRGLELIINTMKFLENSKLLIVGAGEIESELKNLVKKNSLGNCIEFVPRQTPKDLKKITLKADLGISIEEDMGLNYRFALPNKIFDYIQAEIPILVSNLPEMSKIVEKYRVGEIIKIRESEKLANQIKLIKSYNHYSDSLKLAKNELNWENESKVLKNIFSNLE